MRLQTLSFYTMRPVSTPCPVISEKALDCLERCFLKAGTINPDWLENDSDLDNSGTIQGMQKSCADSSIM